MDTSARAVTRVSPAPKVHVPRRDAAVIGLIGAAHFLSHFYILCIPPLFPMIRAELGLSYTALGLIMTALSAVTALGQTPIGVWVDRSGAAPWLIGGTALMALGTAGLGLAPGWPMLAVAALVSGLGNATIHPCDYAILAGSIDQRRMGRAFSLHTAAGYAGFAAAPPLMIALEAWLGWRGALVAVGLAGLPCTFAIAAFAGILRSETKRRHEVASARRVLGSDGVAGGASAYMRLALDDLDAARSWEEARTRLYRIHQIAADELPVIPLWQLAEHFAYAPSATSLTAPRASLFQDVETWPLEPRIVAEGP